LASNQKAGSSNLSGRIFSSSFSSPTFRDNPFPLANPFPSHHFPHPTIRLSTPPPRSFSSPHPTSTPQTLNTPFLSKKGAQLSSESLSHPTTARRMDRMG